MTPPDAVAYALAGLSVYGAASLGHDAYRVARAAGRSCLRGCEWTATKWRARAFAAEQRRVKREEGIGALNAECARDLAAVVVDLRAEIKAREPAVPVVVAAPAPTVPDPKLRADYERSKRYAAHTGADHWHTLAERCDADGSPEALQWATECRRQAQVSKPRVSPFAKPA